MASNDDLRPKWNAARAERIVGCTIIVGITHLEADGETVIEQRQRYGIVVAADPRKGIRIACRGVHQGEIISLPPHLAAFEDAPPGDYRIRETGEVISDPDLMTAWRMVKPAN